MDFDDLDDLDAAAGPTPEELREELRQKASPDNDHSAKHPRPLGKGFGGGNMKYQKVLYLYGPGCNAKMAERQVSALFKNVPWVVDFKIFEWHYFEGEINNKVEEIHADPAVAAMFIPFGQKCGSTYDGYLSYVYMHSESHVTESWLGPGVREKMTSGELKAEDLNDSHSHLPVMEKLAAHLKEHGPYDGICGFDMGGCLAFEAARLAQEGDKRFTEKFRYLMLFSTRGHKEMALLGQGKMRPKAPLQIPTYIGWSLDDDSKQYSHYEDQCLYIHPNYRGVFHHDQGHRPPNIQKNTTQCEQLDSFVGAMQADSRYQPKDTAEVKAFDKFWLPMKREAGPEVPSDAPRKLIVITDPLGEHGPVPEEAADRMRFPAQEDPTTCALRLAGFRLVTGVTGADVKAAVAAIGDGADVEVIEIEYSQAIRDLKWHPDVAVRDVSQAYAAGQGRSRWLQAEDEIALSWSELRRISADLIENLHLTRDEHVGIVGFGTGAHVAFGVAQALQAYKNIMPVGLWAVSPPTVWPKEDVPEMGELVITPIRYMTFPQSQVGPPWRWETSTFGPFSHAYFESKEAMLKIIASEIKTVTKQEP